MDVTTATANGAYEDPARPDTLSLSAMQPTLRLVLIAHHATPRGIVTAIVRIQDPGTVPLCQLCPKADCATAADGTCLVTTDGYVAEAAAASYARPGSLVAARSPGRRGGRVPRR